MAAPFLSLCLCLFLSHTHKHTHLCTETKLKAEPCCFYHATLHDLWEYITTRLLLSLQGKGIHVGLASYLVLKTMKKDIINHLIFIWIVIKDALWTACRIPRCTVGPVTVLKHNYSVAYISTPRCSDSCCSTPLKCVVLYHRFWCHGGFAVMCITFVLVSLFITHNPMLLL